MIFQLHRKIFSELNFGEIRIIARIEAMKQSPSVSKGGDCFAPSGRSQGHLFIPFLTH
jgi:hypothetical protein